VNKPVITNATDSVALIALASNSVVAEATPTAPPSELIDELVATRMRGSAATFVNNNDDDDDAHSFASARL